MRLLKSHPLLKLANAYVIDHSQPTNINYLWNFGSLLGLCLVIQIITGVTLAMHYTPNIYEAFDSVEHIMRDVNNGWLVRYLHSNTASAFFFIVYLHIARGIYYASYRAPRTLAWTLGTIILILMIGTAFLGWRHMAQNEKKLYKFNISILLTKLKFFLITFTLFFITCKNNTLAFFHSQRKQYYYSFNSLRKLNDKDLILLTGSTEISRNNFLDKKFTKYWGKHPFGIRNFSTLPNINNNSINIQEFIKSRKLKPIFIFDNIDQSNIQNEIRLTTKDLGGIYLILNKETLSFYVGSASTNRFNSRFMNHLIYGRGSKLIKNSVKKHGLNNFCFLILELFPEIVTQENNKQLLDIEDFYLKSLLPDYNILTEAGSSFGYKHTEVTRIKLKAIYSEKRRKRIGDLNRNKKFSLERIEKIREAALNRKKPVYSEEAIQNMKKGSKPIMLKELSGIVYGKFSSITETAKAVNCDVKTIRRALNSPSKKLKRRWIVSYL